MKGFALLEVLVSMTLLAVGLVAVLTGVFNALELQRDAALRYRAGLILQDKLAETRLGAWTGGEARGESADGRFAWSVLDGPWRQGRADAAAPDSVTDRLVEVLVEVRWTTDDGERAIRATQLAARADGREESP